MIKKMVSVLLTLTMLVGIVSAIPFTVSAKEAELTGVSADAEAVAVTQGADTQSGEEKLFDDIQYVKYSDLFYAYPDALTQSQYLLEYHTKLYLFTNAIYDEYRQTGSFFWSTLSDAIQNKLSIKSALKTITDAAGWTKFTYNDGLDAANVTFAQNMFKDYKELNGAAKNLKALNKNISDAQKLLAYLNTQGNQMAYDDFFNAIKDYNVYVYVPSSEIDKLKEAVRPDFSKLSDALKVTGEAASAFQYMTVALMIENFRLELIDDILANCEQGTMLYDGMLRLKNQLRNGFSSYFVDNYLKSEIISTITDEIFDKMSAETFFEDKKFKILTVVARVAAKVIFDEIWQFPTVDDIVKQMILSEYELNLYNALESKVDSFKTRFYTSRVFEYEALFTAYVAAAKASLSACEGFITPVTSEMSTETKNKYYELLNTYQDADIYTEHIHSSLYLAENYPPICDNPTNFGAWSVPDGTILVGSSNEISKENNAIYCPTNGLNASIKLQGSATIPQNESVKICGSLLPNFDSSSKQKSDGPRYFNNYGDLKITGNLGNRGGVIITYNYKTIEVDGDIYLGCYWHPWYNVSYYSGIIMSDDAIIKVLGDFTGVYSGYQNIGGTLEFAGNVRQRVNYLNAHNVIVSNPKGIIYGDSTAGYESITGEFLLNGNPLNCNGTTTQITNTTVLDSVSNYGDIEIFSPYTLNHDVTVNNIILRNTLTIPKDANVTITGSIISDANYATQGCLYNYGDLSVTGELNGCIIVQNQGVLEVQKTFYLNSQHGHYFSQGWQRNSYYTGSYSDVSGSITRFGGDCNGTVEINGLVDFSGNGLQTIYGKITANKGIISNPSTDGVVFKQSNVFSGLFDHLQNNFTLERGGSFIDYDGDGMNDNVDPYPTNPENIEPKIIDVKINVNDKAKVLLQNQEFNKYNVTITATYWGGSKKVLDYSIDVDTSSLGTQTATVTYNSGEYQFEVEVVDSITQPFQEDENVTWTLDSNGTMTINGTGNIPPFVRWELEDYSDIIKEVRIEGDIQRIGFEAFSRLPNLQKVDLGNTVEEIEPMAFAENEKLTAIVLPESVTTIGSNAFSYTGITELTIPASVTTLEGYALSDCPNLEKVTILGEISELPYGMFSYCQKLESISLPNTVTAVQADAFNNCSYLKDIYFDGTEEEWNSIAITENGNDLINVTIHYNSSMPNESTDILGDADGDGQITILDVTTIQRYLANYTVRNPENVLKCGDIVGNGLDILDATLIQRYLADITVQYDIGKSRV